MAGTSAGHALIRAGHDVTILERASAMHPAGAGVGVDPRSQAILRSWGLGDQLDQLSCSQQVDTVRYVDPETKVPQLLARNPHHGHRNMHWADLQKMLVQSLPPGTINYGHRVVSFTQEGDKVSVVAEVASKAEGAAPARLVTFEGDLLLGADGITSVVRGMLLPDESKRYAGYFAWRGVLNAEDDPAIVAQLKEEFPDYGSGIHFELGDKTQAVVFELPGNRVNWMFYQDAPEPQLQGHSLTMQASDEQLAAMKLDALKTWTPALAELMQRTASPFINVIYDKEPLHQFAYGRVLLIGDAAHPTTPHGARGANMGLLDGWTLGRLLGELGAEQLPLVLREFEQERIAATAQQVMFSRHLGQLKQGQWWGPGEFSWRDAPAALGALLVYSAQHRFVRDLKAHALALLGGEAGGEMA